jgi:hypothetical protein
VDVERDFMSSTKDLDTEAAEMLERMALEVAVLANQSLGNDAAVEKGLYAVQATHQIVNEAREVAMKLRMRGIHRARRTRDQQAIDTRIVYPDASSARELKVNVVQPVGGDVVISFNVRPGCVFDGDAVVRKITEAITRAGASLR